MTDSSNAPSNLMKALSARFAEHFIDSADTMLSRLSSLHNAITDKKPLSEIRYLAQNAAREAGDLENSVNTLFAFNAAKKTIASDFALAMIKLSSDMHGSETAEEFLPRISQSIDVVWALSAAN